LCRKVAQALASQNSVRQLLNTHITNGVVGYVCQVLVRVLLYLGLPISSIILASLIPFLKTGFFAYSIFTSISEYSEFLSSFSCRSGGAGGGGAGGVMGFVNWHFDFGYKFISSGLRAQQITAD